MRWRRAVLGAVVLATACSGEGDDAADPSAPPSVAATAAGTSARSAEATAVPGTSVSEATRTGAATTDPPPTTPPETSPRRTEPAPTEPAPTEPAPTGPATTDSAGTAPPTAVDATARGYPPQPPDVPYPTTDWPVGDLPAGVDRAAIDAAVETAFGAPDAVGRVRSVVVVQGGRIVYERYHPLDGPDVRFNSFSVAKSFASAMIGQLVADGVLELDAPPPVAEWQAPGDPRQAITLRHLLQMSSGLLWAEEYGPGSLPLQMLMAQDAAGLVASQPLEAAPGTMFEYSTGTTALLAGIAADELGGCAQLTAYLNERLLDPIGITSDQLITDGNGCWVGGLGADMTTRDFARFGLLYLRGGWWDGRPIVPASWVDESRTPAPTNGGYGLQWWLAPGGASFSAEGLFGQRIVIVPGADLVIATNTTQGGDSFRMVDAIRAALGV